MPIPIAMGEEVQKIFECLHSNGHLCYVRSRTESKRGLFDFRSQLTVIIAGLRTSEALAPHARENSWVMFVQVSPPGVIGPIKIEGVRGAKIAERLNAFSVDNPYPVYLIGLIASQSPHEHARAIAEQFIAHHMHDGWFEPTPGLLQHVQHLGQQALGELLAITRPGAVNGEVVDIDAIARMLNVSVSTVRRLVAADAIPHMRVGRQLRFVVADVLASMNHG